MTQPTCPCGSGDPLDDCCGRYHQGHPAPTAEALMRSRYSAYALGLVDYLRDTTLPAQQAGLDLDGIAGIDDRQARDHPHQCEILDRLVGAAIASG